MLASSATNTAETPPTSSTRGGRSITFPTSGRRWRYTGWARRDGGWTGADIEEHVRDEHSTFTWLLEPMIERSEFRIEQGHYSQDGIFAGYVCARA